MNCALCESRNIRQAFVKQGKGFFACKDCGLIFIHPVPSHEVLSKTYDKFYYSNLEIEEYRRVKAATFDRWLDRIERQSHPGKILDCGCATGLFLERAKTRGWDVYGLEISEYSACIAANSFGERVKIGTSDKIDFAAGSFDCVTMFDLIEHISRPVPYLKEVLRVLKPGGVVALSTVNTGSLSHRLMRSAWPHFHPEHLCYYSAHVLRSLLERAGFKVLETRGAEKYLTLAYVKCAFQAHPSFFFRGASRFLVSVLPPTLSNLPLRVKTGEMFILAKKEED